MNCKPGDLAVIVRTLPAGEFLLGRFVHVLSQAEDVIEGHAWLVRLQAPICNPLNGASGAEGVAADAFLRPIRDPGDDAKDETLSWIKPPHAPASLDSALARLRSINSHLESLAQSEIRRRRAAA